MFAGTFQHSLDAKNRLVIPSKLRTFLTDPDDKKGFFVTLWEYEDAACLYMYPIHAWQETLEKLQNASDRSEDGEWLLRKFTSDAEFTKIDKQGRMVIPERLIEEASLTKNIVLVGVHDHIEVWDKKTWNKKSNWMSTQYSKLRSKRYGTSDFIVRINDKK